MGDIPYWKLDDLLAFQRYNCAYSLLDKEQQAVIHSYRDALVPFIDQLTKERVVEELWALDSRARSIGNLYETDNGSKLHDYIIQRDKELSHTPTQQEIDDDQELDEMEARVW